MSLPCEIVPGRPLVVSDADEVLLQFLGGLEVFLPKHGHRLDLTSYALTGNIKRAADGVAATHEEVSALLKDFYLTDGLNLQVVPGAKAALDGLARHCQVVVLSNVTPEAAVGRAENLKRHGIDYPVLSNSGGKGKVLQMLGAAAQAPVFFVDDIAFHHEDVAKAWPDTHSIHFVADPRLFAMAKRAEPARLFTSSWPEAAAHILGTLGT